MNKILANKKRTCFIVLLLTVLVFVAICITLQERNTVFAASADVKTEEYSSLDSDYIIGYEGLTIRDYPNKLHATKAAVNSKDNGGFELSGLNEDDPIVSIIPKEYFFNVGQILKMGDEYGYFIDTKQKANQNYLSNVMVFDITTNTDLTSTIDRVIVEVTPIFQYKYVGLTNNAEAEMFHGFYLSYGQLTDSCVVPYPSKMENYTFVHTLEYGMTEDYYLKDVSFGASLFNEQSLNRGDSGYDPYNDYGSYFTGFDYSYQGKYREYGEFNGADLGWNIADSVFYWLGYFDAVPVVGSVTSVLGQIYSTVSLGKGWIDFAVDTYNAVEGEIKSTENKLTATCYYQNRDDQLKYYKDEKGNPVLTKTATLVVDSGTEKSIWYGVGDNVTAYFSIGHSALNGKIPNHTRFTNQLGLQIVSSNNDEVVAAGSTIISDSLREQETKTLTLDESSDIYMLPEGGDKFTFDAEFASDYNIQFDTDSNVDVIVNGQTYHGKNFDIDVSVRSGERIDITIAGNEKGIHTPISGTPSTNLTGMNIPGNEYYLLKTNELSGVTSLTTSNANIVISGFYIKGDDGLILYDEYGSITETNEISYPFPDDESYYIVLHNKTGSSKSDISINIAEIPTITEGNPKSLELLSNYSYYEFRTGSTGGRYVQTVSGTETDDLRYKVLNQNFDPITNGYSYVDGEYIMSFSPNTTYYIAIISDKKDTASVTINRESKAYQWQISGGKFGNGYITYDREIYAPRGTSYILEFLVNGIVVDTNYYSEDDVHNYFGGYDISVNQSGVLNIPSSTPVRGSGITVYAKYNNEASYDHSLKLIPDFADKLNVITKNMESTLGFSVSVPKYVKTVHYTLSVGGKEASFTRSISNYKAVNYITEDIQSNYNTMGYSGIGNITITIDRLDVVTAVNSTYSYNCNYSAQVHNLFGGGDGSASNPFTLSCYRHLNNMRKAVKNSRLDYNFKMTSDILMKQTETNYYWDAWWELIPATFYGVFDGNGYQIRRLNLVMPTDGSTIDSYYGLFRINRGTIKNLKLYEGGTNTYKQMGQDTTKTIYVGMIAGKNYGTITNCTYESGKFNMCFFAPNVYSGGIAGYNNGKINNCSVQIYSLDGYGHKGGIVGYNASSGTVTGCKVEGLLSARYSPDEIERTNQYSVGGIVGINYGKVTNNKNYATLRYVSCGNEGDSRVLQPRIGQIIGSNYGTYSGNTCSGSVDKGVLKTVTWTTGILWWKETHTHNQAQYVSSGIYGYNG